VGPEIDPQRADLDDRATRERRAAQAGAHALDELLGPDEHRDQRRGRERQHRSHRDGRSERDQQHRHRHRGSVGDGRHEIDDGHVRRPVHGDPRLDVRSLLRAKYTFQTARQADGAMLAWKTLVLRSALATTLCAAKGGGNRMGGPPDGGMGGPPDGG